MRRPRYVFTTVQSQFLSYVFNFYFVLYIDINEFDISYLAYHTSHFIFSFYIFFRSFEFYSKRLFESITFLVSFT